MVNGAVVARTRGNSCAAAAAGLQRWRQILPDDRSMTFGGKGSPCARGASVVRNHVANRRVADMWRSGGVPPALQSVFLVAIGYRIYSE